MQLNNLLVGALKGQHETESYYFCHLQLQDLLNTYYPIEIDSSRSIEEKLPLMVEWWTKAHELLVEQKIRKDLLATAVRESNAMLR